MGVYSQTELQQMKYDSVTQELKEEVRKREEAEKREKQVREEAEK